MKLDDTGHIVRLAFAHGEKKKYSRLLTPASPSLEIKGVAGSEIVNGWGKAGGGGGGGERAGGHPVCRGGCNRSIAEAEVVAEEGNRRDGAALHDGVRRPAAALCKSPGLGRVTVKHWSHLGLTYTPCRPALDEDETGRRTPRINHCQYIDIADSVMGALIPRLNIRTSLAMSTTHRDDGRRGTTRIEPRNAQDDKTAPCSLEHGWS